MYVCMRVAVAVAVTMAASGPLCVFCVSVCMCVRACMCVHAACLCVLCSQAARACSVSYLPVCVVLLGGGAEANPVLERCI